MTTAMPAAPMTTAVPAAPMMTTAMPVTTVVTGVDMNRDGIPDVLQRGVGAQSMIY